MEIKKPQLVKVEAFAYFFQGWFCNTLYFLGIIRKQLHIGFTGQFFV